MQNLRIGDREMIGCPHADPDLCHCIYWGDTRLAGER
jgi:hypothetical protein